MALFLLAVIIIVGVLYQPLVEAFVANSALNGLIVGVLVLGIAYIFRQVFMLMTEEAWLDNFRSNRPGFSVQQAPRLLAPMAAMLGDRKEQRFSLSALSLRSLLDGISSRLEESRDLSRYLIGLLIFLGLLGTFWGLLQTIRSVGDVIGGLSVGGDLNSVFGNLKAGLRAPLSGMGTAFSSSLFGLAGSLILGFLELQAGQAQNHFFNQLEDWLASQTRLSSGVLSIGEGGDAPVPVYVQALLEQTADSLESLQRTLERGEESRANANNSISSLTEKLVTLTDQMRTEQSLMMKLAENQLELRPILARLAEGPRGGFADDDGTRTHIRNIDVYMARLIEELATGRSEMVEELRTEIRVLSRTIAATSERPAAAPQPLRAPTARRE
jgi:hypothetical protein